MADNSVSLDVIIRMVLEGRGGDLGKEQIEALTAASEELTEAGQKAYDTLLKLGQEPSSRADAANDMRARARSVGGEVKQSDLSAGAGLATGDPAKELERLAAAERKARDEKEAATAATRNAKQEQADETAQTDKAVKSKQTLRDGLKGLALEFPHAAEAARAMTSPIGALTVAAVALAAKLTEDIRAAEEFARQIEEVGRAGENVDPLSVIRMNIGRDTNEFVRSFDAIAAAAKKVTDGLNEQTAAYLQKQALEQQLDDETLKRQSAEVNAQRAQGLITQREANLRVAQLQDEARDRKEARDLASVQERARLAAQEAENQKRAAAAGAETVGAIDEALPSQQDQANKSAADAQAMEALGRSRMQQLNDLQHQIQEYRDILADTSWRQKLNPGTPFGLKGGLPQIELAFKGVKDVDAKEQEILAEWESWKRYITQAKEIAAQEANRLAEMQAARQRAAQESLAAEQARVEAEAQAAKLMKEYQLRLENQGKIEEQRRAAGEATSEGLKAQGERAARERAIEIQLENLRRKLIESPDSINLLRDINDRETELRNLRSFGPENRELNDAKSAREKAGAEAEIRRRMDEQFRRDNRVGAAGGLPDAGSAFAAPSRGIEQIGVGIEKAAVQMERSVAMAMRRVSDVERRLSDLADRVAASRV